MGVGVRYLLVPGVGHLALYGSETQDLTHTLRGKERAWWIGQTILGHMPRIGPAAASRTRASSSLAALSQWLLRPRVSYPAQGPHGTPTHVTLFIVEQPDKRLRGAWVADDPQGLRRLPSSWEDVRRAVRDEGLDRPLVSDPARATTALQRALPLPDSRASGEAPPPPLQTSLWPPARPNAPGCGRRRGRRQGV